MNFQTVAQKRELDRANRPSLKSALREVIALLKSTNETCAKANEYQSKHFVNERRVK